MTGTKKDREALKNRYRKGMYPTENDFADVFESYVHKDDDIPMSKVVITDGDGKTTTLSGEIDKKADKTTLQTFIDETETILQVVRNDNNQIASTAIDNLHSRIQAAEDDIDTAEDNISGHETRIATLESSKTDYEAFKERVRAFMEDADASDATINRWREIEPFLQGITDTETLTVLLNDLKNEILAAIPSPQSGNFIEYTTDLDAITDAPNGKIMQYWGQSNDKYKRGQFYERVEGEGVEIPAKTKYNSTADMYLLNSWQIPVGVQQFGKDWWLTLSGTTDIDTLPESLRRLLGEMKVETTHFKNGSITALFTSVTTVEGDFWQKLPNLGEISQGSAIENGVYEGITGNGDRYLFTPHYFFKISDGGRFEKGTVDYTAGIMSYYYDHAATTIETPSSWQHIHVDEVID